MKSPGFLAFRYQHYETCNETILYALNVYAWDRWQWGSMKAHTEEAFILCMVHGCDDCAAYMSQKRRKQTVQGFTRQAQLDRIESMLAQVLQWQEKLQERADRLLKEE